MKKQQKTDYMKYIISALVLVSCFGNSLAQDTPQVVDKIIAKVDNHIILYSDVELAYIDASSRGMDMGPNPKCQVLESLVTQKMMLAKAEIDSVEVLDAEVEIRLDRKIQSFIAQSGGSVEALEEYYGKSLDQIQSEMRDQEKDQMVIQKMQEVISADVNVTPSQVKRFFNKIPKDSLPYFSEEVEVAQIVKIARIGQKQKIEVEKKLRDIKTQIEGGADFAVLAKKHSQDPGSARTGGELPGWYKRGELAPEYEAECFKLKPGELSDPVETQFGFHLIGLIDRRGNEFRTKHILLSPSSSDLDIEFTTNELDSVKILVESGDQEFEKVAKDFSDDKLSAPGGGYFLDRLGASRIPVDQLEPTVYFALDSLQVGDISAPMPYRMHDGKEAIRIIYYKSKIPPHQASLEVDWQKIQAATLNEKQAKAQQKWVEESRGDVFIHIADDFSHCDLGLN